MDDSRPGLERFDPRETYDQAALDYVRAAERFWDFLSHRSVSALELRPGARVLDAPSGPGTAALAAAEAVGGTGRVVALDSSSRMLGIARTRAASEGSEHVEFIEGDMTALAFPDESFDAVLSVLGIFFVEDIAGLLRSLWRLVKPGGRLAVTTLGRGVFEPAITVWKDVVRAEKPDALLSFPWQRTDDPEEVARLFAAAGISGAHVRLEPTRVDLPTADDWWLAVMGSGMRRTILELDDRSIERVRARCSEELDTRGVRDMQVPGIYARASKDVI